MEGRASISTGQGAVVHQQVRRYPVRAVRNHRSGTFEAREARGEDQKKSFAKLTLAAAITLAATNRPAPLSHIAAQLTLAGIYC